jgi:hypothetical protein
MLESVSRASSLSSTISTSSGFAPPWAAMVSAAAPGTSSPIEKLKQVPRPSSLCSTSSPPIRATSRWQITSPRPVPPKRRVVLASAWVKPWKIRPWFSGAMPMPVSRTAIATATRPGPARVQRSETTTWPCWVNLMALPARLTSTWRRRRASPMRRGGTAGSMSNRTSISLSPTLAESTTASSRNRWSTSKGSGSSVSLPASTFEKSRMSLSRPSSERAAFSDLLA